ncbi:hypothetical protein T4A_11010 [Trichinella pseudospiralis]|uniref:Uncharacterized protein n=1 Tax=Trichinella pseudospiralis TaxID=6337 RepID=A0A0V1ETS6_TRIPS|nr:hypothetical protein T4A_11010 [Trichinella pseudospiralis]
MYGRKEQRRTSIRPTSQSLVTKYRRQCVEAGINVKGTSRKFCRSPDSRTRVDSQSFMAVIDWRVTGAATGPGWFKNKFRPEEAKEEEEEEEEEDLLIKVRL